MATKKKTTALKSKPTVNGTAPGSADIFEILADPPPPIRGATLEVAAFLEKLERTLEKVQVGQAFIIPRKREAIAKRYIKPNYPNERFTYMKIPDNPEFMRVYRLPLDKKVKTKPSK